MKVMQPLRFAKVAPPERKGGMARSLDDRRRCPKCVGTCVQAAADRTGAPLWKSDAAREEPCFRTGWSEATSRTYKKSRHHASIRRSQKFPSTRETSLSTAILHVLSRCRAQQSFWTQIHCSPPKKMAVAEKREAEPTTQREKEVKLAVQQATSTALAESCRQKSCKPINSSYRSHAEPWQSTVRFLENFGPHAWAW